MEVAIIDCGTNTFTLNLFEINKERKFKRIGKSRHYVELAAEGVDSIGPKAFQRGVKAFRAFRVFLEKHPEAQVHALGTAALRKASNSDALVQAAYEASNIKINIISGEQEADYIYQGVSYAAPLSEKPSLIMDIGGGSVELIIGNKNTIYWSKSYPVGVAVLYEYFQKSDPINAQDKAALQAHLQATLADFLVVLEQYDIEHFIGSSGSFNMLQRLAGTRAKDRSHSFIKRKDLETVTQELVQSNYEERLKIPNLKTKRAKLSVMSALLIDFVQQHLDNDEMIVSEHAMREGLLLQLLE
jgi:exopolyphosphatase/guanosine-5'-triphosphate,3'-diphosphate pyrophosphatase